MRNLNFDSLEDWVGLNELKNDTMRIFVWYLYIRKSPIEIIILGV